MTHTRSRRARTARDARLLRRTCSARGAVFRRATSLYGPIAALRRAHRSRQRLRGADSVSFSEYVKDGGDATLALMGVKLMSLPEEPFIRFAGLLSDRERAAGARSGDRRRLPVAVESLSLLALEALAVGTPILANARSAVLVEHCVRSNGGLYYADRDEFVECAEAAGRRRAPARRRWAATAATTSGATTGGTSCSGKYDRIFARVRNR